MPRDYDHIQALTNMMENLKRETEAKCRDIQEVILSLKKAPKLISEVRQILKTTTVASSPSLAPRERVYNKKMPELLKEYLETFPTNEVIRVPRSSS